MHEHLFLMHLERVLSVTEQSGKDFDWWEELSAFCAEDVVNPTKDCNLKVEVTV